MYEQKLYPTVIKMGTMWNAISSTRLGRINRYALAQPAPLPAFLFCFIKTVSSLAFVKESAGRRVQGLRFCCAGVLFV